jgi:hypothetical protein
LSGIQIKNWTALQNFILRYQVEELDTRGAVISNMEEFWQQLLALDYSCCSASGVKCYLSRIVSQEVSEWADGTLLKEFQVTGTAEISVI